ncbi:hypothetical protein LWI28_008784 [Acer negundo]|uniref:Uncharacterized protein n=1 Tax=Acer negundo TaxID=4023 RepID=A0AAD5JQH9_ACENE|nr:hypothetical protein LWI28_008784 [Acer negundo]KAK4857499.1 hypothetical protein QYF36_001626 [Acer negundo]
MNHNEDCKRSGIPLQLDETTKDQSNGYFVRVLVDKDLTASLPTSIMVKRDDHRGFSIEVIYENLPGKCSKCQNYGHNANKCRNFVSDNKGTSLS